MHFFASFSIEMLDTFKWSMIQLEKILRKMIKSCELIRDGQDGAEIVMIIKGKSTTQHRFSSLFIFCG